MRLFNRRLQFDSQTSACCLVGLLVLSISPSSARSESCGCLDCGTSVCQSICHYDCANCCKCCVYFDMRFGKRRGIGGDGGRADIQQRNEEPQLVYSVTTRLVYNLRRLRKRLNRRLASYSHPQMTFNAW